ncbi:MAG: hypothetical protein GXP08_16290 [Gammaproteobacteria bacterium]|nr:hypothetical protein [Gammaproteobacteria bacterium]
MIVIAVSGTPVCANAASGEPVSMELLEFLGEWQTEEGDWVDPMRFLNVSENDLDSEQLKKTSSHDVVNEESSND